MDKPHLQEILGKLHSELEQIEALDDGSREQLQALMYDIQTVLERSNPHHFTPHDRTLIERLKINLHQFEGTHTVLTSTISQLAYILSQMGI